MTINLYCPIQTCQEKIREKPLDYIVHHLSLIIHRAAYRFLVRDKPLSYNHSSASTRLPAAGKKVFPLSSLLKKE